jgi:transcriptional regulator with XRE-family HTH domain
MMKGAFRRIRYERLQRGWNQTVLARLVHIRQQEISLIEQGRLIPSPEQYDRISRVLGVPPEELLHLIVVEKRVLMMEPPPEPVGVTTARVREAR